MIDLYVILEVERSATTDEIRKNYKRLAMSLHPDRGGSEERFKTLKEAYEILIDSEKRRYYDQTGRVSNDNKEDNVIQIVNSLILNILNLDTEVDVIKEALNKVNESIINKNNSIQTLKNLKDKLEKRSKKLKRKNNSNKTDFIQAAIESKIDEIDKNVLNIENLLKIDGRVIEVLNEYEYILDESIFTYNAPTNNFFLGF